jgi:hypothetical protein
MKCVRVIRTGKGTNLYAGILAELWFDPIRWEWGDTGGLCTYTTKRGRKLLSTRVELLRPIHQKWRGLLPVTYKPCFSEVWNLHRPQKEAGFMWSMYHWAVAVNYWRAQISIHISPLCPCCPLGLNKSILHRFHSCLRTKAT